MARKSQPSEPVPFDGQLDVIQPGDVRPDLQGGADSPGLTHLKERPGRMPEAEPGHRGYRSADRFPAERVTRWPPRRRQVRRPLIKSDADPVPRVPLGTAKPRVCQASMKNDKHAE
jgi:hypothetical protein